MSLASPVDCFEFKKGCFGILSCMAYSHRQKACRETWLPTLCCDYVFIIGQPGIKESTRIGDILYVDCPDTYSFLTFKTIKFLEWAKSRYDWIFKCDDDTYCNSIRFEKWLLSLEKKPQIYIGRILDSLMFNRIIKEEKCSEESKRIARQLLQTRFPSGGAGYFLSKDLLEKPSTTFLKENPGLEPFAKSCEDVCIAAILSHYSVFPQKEERFDCGHSKLRLFCEDLNTGITKHWLSPEKMLLLHEAMLAPKNQDFQSKYAHLDIDPKELCRHSMHPTTSTNLELPFQ